MKIDLEKLCNELLEEKRKKRKKKFKKRSSKRYGWGFIGYGPGVYDSVGDAGGGDGGGGE